jgi:3-oxoacyl-[acyl-carrier-protein] synthase-3
MGATITAVASYLPEKILSNAILASQFTGWTAEKIESKTGIVNRHVAESNEFASDLAVKAVERLLANNAIDRLSVDAIFYCTQSPDYILPTTACLLQNRLGLKQSVAALDFNLGCSGFVYGLGLVNGFIAGGQAQRVLLITSDTYSRYLHPGDRGVRTLFGDAAAAVLIDKVDGAGGLSGPFIYGTDGGGWENLMIPTGGLRCAVSVDAKVTTDVSGNQRTVNHLFMNGPEIFNFTLRVVPATVVELLERAELILDQIDLFVFHQANGYMLEHLRKRLMIPREKFVVSMQETGNTVSSTIPIALEKCIASGQLKRGMRVMLLGFGVGYSWAGTILEW